MDRIIHTNLYSNKAFNIINNLLYIAQNNHYGKISRSIGEGRFEREKAPDGEITFKIKDVDCYTFYRTVWYNRDTDRKALDWIANMIKDSVYRKIRAEGDLTDVVWNRCSEKSYDFGFYNAKGNYETVNYAISDIYCIYDLLKNRKNITAKYSEDLLAEIKGEQLDPVAAECERARREEHEKIILKYKELRNQLDSEYWDRRKKAETEISEWKKNEYAKLANAEKKEVEDLNAMAAFIC